jgi:hypothetical protein
VVEYLLDNAKRIGLNVDAGNQNDASPLYISWYLLSLQPRRWRDHRC